MLLVLDIWLDAAAFYWNGQSLQDCPSPITPHCFSTYCCLQINFIFIFRLLMKIEDQCRPKTDPCRILLEADLSNNDFPLSVSQLSYNPFNMVMILFGSGF